METGSEEKQGNQEEEKVTYPIAEVFTSVQGEGTYAGKRMVFIRLAGCNVGKPNPTRMLLNQLPTYHEICHTQDGREFICDTNFRKSESWTLQEILNHVSAAKVKHVCFTGGEPLMHDIRSIIDGLRVTRVKIHIETSGTLQPYWLGTKSYDSVWVTVSPKHGCLTSMIHRANAIKLLVDKDFNLEKIHSSIRSHTNVFLQPIDPLIPGSQIIRAPVETMNVAKCLEVQKTEPEWTVCIQMHKVIGVR